MLKSSSYIYLVSRAHGLATHLLKKEEIESLAKTSDLKGFLENVSKGDYVRWLGGLDKESVDAKSLSRIFASVYVDRLVHLTRITSGRFRAFLTEYLGRVEVENLKRVLRAKMGDKPISLEDLLPLPREFETINFSDVVNVKSLDDVSFHLAPSPYREAVDAFPLAKSMGSTYPIELLVENIYFTNTLEAAAKLPSAKSISEVIRNEYAASLVYNVLAMKFLGSPMTVFEKYTGMISKGLGVSPEFVNDLLRSREDTVVGVIRGSRFSWLAPYIEEAVEKGSVVELYRAVKRGFAEYFRSIGRKKPLDMVYVLWYLYSAEYEYINLSTIATAKELGLDPSEIPIF